MFHLLNHIVDEMIQVQAVTGTRLSVAGLQFVVTLPGHLPCLILTDNVINILRKPLHIHNDNL